MKDRPGIASGRLRHHPYESQADAPARLAAPAEQLADQGV
jgi:hypothetical protein